MKWFWQTLLAKKKDLLNTYSNEMGCLVDQKESIFGLIWKILLHIGGLDMEREL